MISLLNVRQGHIFFSVKEHKFVAKKSKRIYFRVFHLQYLLVLLNFIRCCLLAVVPDQCWSLMTCNSDHSGYLSKSSLNFIKFLRAIPSILFCTVS